MKIKVLDLEGKQIKEIVIKKLDESEIVPESLVRYIKVYLSNQHQGTSHTKTKAEVRGGGKKPWAQKHTGRARAGTRRSPLWVGGGIAHGPRSKSIESKLNKAIKKEALIVALHEKASEGNLNGVNFEGLSAPKTKIIEKLAKAIKTDNLLILHDSNSVLYKSARNISKVKVMDISEFNPFNVVKATSVAIDEKALSKLEERL